MARSLLFVLVSLILWALSICLATASTTVARGAGRFEPVATWSGRLLFPAGGTARRADGGVLIELHNWDKGALAVPGSSWPVLPLAFEGAPYAPDGFDVTLSERARRSLGGSTPEECYNKPAWRLIGLSRVSALESLAGYRGEDDVEVSLTAPELRQTPGEPLGVLVVREAPVEVVGTHVALVSFKEGAGPGTLVGAHYSPGSRTFDGPTETFLVPDDVPFTNRHQDPKLHLRRTSVEGIHASALNGDGFYAYGRSTPGGFLVEGLEPRALMRASPGRVEVGVPEGKHFIEREPWDADLLRQNRGKFRSTLLLPEPESTPSVVRSWRDGRRLLVLHVFGGFGVDGTPELPGLQTGHFSFGFADVATCPFTGEPRFRITYRQVYATNETAILSSSVAWSAYAGSLRRGWMYLRPMSDVLVDFPPLLADYEFEGNRISPAGILVDALERVMAAYRVGGGEGAAMVTLLNSCVQDSVQALFLAFESLFADEDTPWSAARDHPGLAAFRRWAEAPDQTDPEAVRWRRLRDLHRRGSPLAGPSLCTEFFRANLGPSLGVVWRKDWRQNLRQPRGFVTSEVDDKVMSVLDGVATCRNSILPRRTQDILSKLFLERGARLWVLNPTQVGGSYPGLEPVAADKLTWPVLRRLKRDALARLWAR